MTKRMLLTLAALSSLAAGTTVHAASVMVGAASTISVDGLSYTLVGDKPNGVMWEEDGQGGYKSCGCKMSAFRALQAVGDYLGLNDTFTTAAMRITTGWNTHGPEELYDETLGWKMGENFDYASPITDTKNLTLADAWYEFTLVPGGEGYRVNFDAWNYRFTHDSTLAGYHSDWDFFAYRTFAQNTIGTSDEMVYFRTVVRPQFIDNLKGETRFEVNAVAPVPIPGAVWLLGSAMAGMAVVRRRKRAGNQSVADHPSLSPACVGRGETAAGS